jgi:hypothetical protein
LIAHYLPEHWPVRCIDENMQRASYSAPKRLALSDLPFRPKRVFLFGARTQYDGYVGVSALFAGP